MWSQIKEETCAQTHKREPQHSVCEKPKTKKRGKKNKVIWKKEEQVANPGQVIMFQNLFNTNV